MAGNHGIRLVSGSGFAGSLSKPAGFLTPFGLRVTRRGLEVFEGMLKYTTGREEILQGFDIL